ncbi:MAG: hypothetical protein AAFR61_10465 [Bacteroidota bacterium]
MRPLLQIGNLINLQDARSSAAVGFDMINFSLAKGDPRKLSVSLVWNIIQWLSGPEVVLEINAESQDELKEATAQFPIHFAAIPYADRQAVDFSLAPAWILRGFHPESPAAVEAALAEIQALDRPVYLELSLETALEALAYEAYFPDLFLHFEEMREATTFVQLKKEAVKGLSFYDEAEEEFGQLHYENIDDFLEVFFDQYERDP